MKYNTLDNNLNNKYKFSNNQNKSQISSNNNYLNMRIN